MGFQAFGAVDGEQAHSARRVAGGGLEPTGFERAHEAVKREEATTVNRQRLGKQIAQLRQHRRALAGRLRLRKTREHIAVVKDGGQRVVWRQRACPGLVQAQALSGCAQGGSLDLEDHIGLTGLREREHERGDLVGQRQLSETL